MLFCTQRDGGGKTPWLKFGMLSSACVDQGLRVQRLLALVHISKSSGHVAQLRGWRTISQPLTTTPGLKLMSFRAVQRDTALFSLLCHFPPHHPRPHCSSRSTGRWLRPAQSQGHSKFAIAPSSGPSLRLSPDLTSHIPPQSEHPGQPEEDCSLLNTVDNWLHSVGVHKEGTNRPCLV